MEQVNQKSILCHRTNVDYIIIIVTSECVFCSVASSLILVRRYGSMWSCWNAREKKSNWREPEWWMHSHSVWKRVKNNAPSCCRQVCELHMNITEQLTPTLPYSCSHLIDLIMFFIFRFSARDESNANQTTAGTVSQGPEWEHEQSFTGLSSDFSKAQLLLWLLMNKLHKRFVFFHFHPKGGYGWSEGADRSVWICSEARCHCDRPKQQLGEPAVWILCGFGVEENKQEKRHA